MRAAVVLVVDENARRGVGEQAAQLRRREPGVERRRDRGQARRGHHRLEVGGPVAQHQRHAVAPRHPRRPPAARRSGRSGRRARDSRAAAPRPRERAARRARRDARPDGSRCCAGRNACGVGWYTRSRGGEREPEGRAGDGRAALRQRTATRSPRKGWPSTPTRSTITTRSGRATRRRCCTTPSATSTSAIGI